MLANQLDIKYLLARDSLVQRAHGNVSRILQDLTLGRYMGQPGAPHGNSGSGAQGSSAGDEGSIVDPSQLNLAATAKQASLRATRYSGVNFGKGSASGEGEERSRHRRSVENHSSLGDLPLPYEYLPSIEAREAQKQRASRTRENRTELGSGNAESAEAQARTLAQVQQLLRAVDPEFYTRAQAKS